MADRWEFWLERRAGVWVVVFRDGGCSPASTVEEWALRKLGRVKQEAAILAESESATDDVVEPVMSKSRLKRLVAQGALPLGHVFEPYPSFLCTVCGDPRSAHEPKP